MTQKNSELVEQYKSVRDEIVQSIRLQAQYFQISVSILVIVLVGSVRFLEETMEIFYVNVIVLPIMSYAMALIWACEYRRMRRAGTYAIELESKLFGEHSWTTYKRNHESQKDFLSTRVLKVSVIVSFGLISLLFGFHRVSDISTSGWLFGASINLLTLSFTATNCRRLFRAK